MSVTHSSCLCLSYLLLIGSLVLVHTSLLVHHLANGHLVKYTNLVFSKDIRLQWPIAAVDLKQRWLSTWSQKIKSQQPDQRNHWLFKVWVLGHTFDSIKMYISISLYIIYILMNKTIGAEKDDFAEIEEIWNEPEPHFVCLITPEVFWYSVIVSLRKIIFPHIFFGTSQNST